VSEAGAVLLWEAMRVTALPPAQWRLMVTCDGAGASHALVKDLDRLAARHGCQGIYVVGWELGAREESLPGQRRAHHGHGPMWRTSGS
jgi:hypothetical protein